VSKHTQVWMMSPKRAVESFIHAFELPSDAWGMDRALNLPGISVSIEEMVATLEKVAGKATVDRVEFTPDPVIEEIVSTWPAEFESTRARAMGFKGDEDFASILQS